MDKVEIKEWIIQEFKNGKIRDTWFPMLSVSGVRDYSETVHSIGLNYITEIGRQLDGYTAVSEYPVYPINENFGHNITRVVRPDSIWYDKEDLKPVLVSEFERFENSKAKNDKLREKIENLLIAYHQLGGNLPFILFVYWSHSGVVSKDIEKYISIFDEGFRLPNGIYINGINSFKSDYLVFQAVAKGNKEKLTINQWIQVK
ncbi:hypothetical protein JOC78_001989 [Bacillus ectoiniformans]|uniref:hypothetical protein n=1 Tax=Bacillus ectoiniformans TaxID=1494429 RepID=UPI00195DB021|nr:hypothetical protein [Bacillus ectoiniformans]MBM7649036.1 hypothetical protein [Bacillus ectoiniformans]